ncbi:guanine deaminase [Kitasatospora sp. MAA4]|uniref:nucleoside deaminase n=1 Tax=Kitasatospora sp. MAA4 TaxID=3035093 RepID=UPI002473118A|nr:nucleoside deaminase [Kitasatospora sp. MAA4]MDH6132930.1 guanine deaminase [Kitasatospora sp. MAA4]
MSITQWPVVTQNPSSAQEEAWMGLALDLAVENVGAGGGPFGAVVLRDGEILGQSGNRVTESHDPTAHAEIMAIRAACRTIGDFRLDGALLVSSCEPCPMCLTAVLWARVERVVFAADRHDAADAGFDDLEFYQLLERPRSTWSVPVTRLPHRRASRPFETWTSYADRIDY